MVSVTATVSGNTVMIQVSYSVLDVGLPNNWAVYISAKTDHGQGMSTGMADYPYYVTRFTGSGSTTLPAFTNSPDNYVAELVLQGTGVDADYTTFIIPVTYQCSNGVCVQVPSGCDTNLAGCYTTSNCNNLCGGGAGGILGSITIPSSVSVNTGKITTITSTCKNTAGDTIPCLSLIWGSGTPSIASVDNNGTVTGVSAGTSLVNCWDSQTGTIVSNACIVTVSTIPITYQCKNYSCQQSSCPVGTAGCWTSSNCNNVCSGGGTPPQGAWTCDPVKCPDNGKNYCISGNCIPKTYVLVAAMGFFALMMLNR